MINSTELKEKTPRSADTLAPNTFFTLPLLDQLKKLSQVSVNNTKKISSLMRHEKFAEMLSAGKTLKISRTLAEKLKSLYLTNLDENFSEYERKTWFKDTRRGHVLSRLQVVCLLFAEMLYAKAHDDESGLKQTLEGVVQFYYPPAYTKSHLKQILSATCSELGIQPLRIKKTNIQSESKSRMSELIADEACFQKTQAEKLLIITMEKNSELLNELMKMRSDPIHQVCEERLSAIQNKWDELTIQAAGLKNENKELKVDLEVVTSSIIDRDMTFQEALRADDEKARSHVEKNAKQPKRIAANTLACAEKNIHVEQFKDSGSRGWWFSTKDESIDIEKLSSSLNI